mgnify:FL=1
MRNYKLFGLLIVMLWAIALALVIIGCINVSNTWLCLSLVGIGVLITYISEGLINACEEWFSEEIK